MNFDEYSKTIAPLGAPSNEDGPLPIPVHESLVFFDTLKDAYCSYLLNQSRDIIVQFIEAGFPVPQDWLDYRKAIKTIRDTEGDPEEWPNFPASVAIEEMSATIPDRIEAAELLLSLLLEDPSRGAI